MEQESGLRRVVKRIFGKDRPHIQKVSDLIPLPPTSSESSKQIKTTVSPNPDINNTSEVEINPQEFNQKHKN